MIVMMMDDDRVMVMMMDDDRVMVAFHLHVLGKNGDDEAERNDCHQSNNKLPHYLAPVSFSKTDMQPVQQNEAPINV
jgi:hypothetical protein